MIPIKNTETFLLNLQACRIQQIIFTDHLGIQIHNKVRKFLKI